MRKLVCLVKKNGLMNVIEGVETNAFIRCPYQATQCRSKGRMDQARSGGCTNETKKLSINCVERDEGTMAYVHPAEPLFTEIEAEIKSLMKPV